MSDMSEADEVVALVAAVRPFFLGKPHEVQGAALADMVATWLARYVRGDPKATESFRKDVLALHVETVRRLVPHYEAPVKLRLRADA
jgi:hypothetical protein